MMKYCNTTVGIPLNDNFGLITQERFPEEKLPFFFKGGGAAIKNLSFSTGERPSVRPETLIKNNHCITRSI